MVNYRQFIHFPLHTLVKNDDLSVSVNTTNIYVYEVRTYYNAHVRK